MDEHDYALLAYRVNELDKPDGRVEKVEDRVKVLEGATWWKGTLGSLAGTLGALVLALVIAKLSGLLK